MPLQRVRKMWYSLFLIRIWRQFILSKKEYTLKDNFLTGNCYSCIEINAHSLILCLIHLKKINKPEWFLPHLYDSQACESTFRKFRSMTTAYSVITNCTVKETLSRIGKIQFQNEIIHNTSPSFTYPRANRNNSQEITFELPAPKDIYNEIIFCKRTAIVTATKIGLISRINKSKQTFMCKINPHIPNDNKRLKRLKRSVVCNTVFKLPDLKNIQLKDFSNRRNNVIDEKSPYAEIQNRTGKMIVVKKTSLCWLLRRESQRVSSDRLERVKHNSTKSKSKKNAKFSFKADGKTTVNVKRRIKPKNS